MAYDTRIISDQIPDDEDSENSRGGLNCAPPETDYAAPALERLPPDPYRSLGGFMNYEGWPDCERLIELDREIQRQAQKHVECSDDSENPAAPHPVHRPPSERVGRTSRKNTGPNQLQSTSVREVRIAQEDRLATIWSELEDLRIRRL